MLYWVNYKSDPSTQFFDLTFKEKSLLSNIHHVVDILQKGGVVALPTDTIYGLGEDISNE